MNTNLPDKLEIWDYTTYENGHLLARRDSSFAPVKGDLFNIKGVTYKVFFRSFAIDYSDRPLESYVVCHVSVKKVKR